MSGDPELVLDEDVFRFILSLTSPQRKRLISHLERLRSHWNEEPDFREQDQSGRWLSVKVLRPFLVTYWLDGPVNELRIVDVEKVRA
jgi:hypothetical protein